MSDQKFIDELITQNQKYFLNALDENKFKVLAKNKINFNKKLLKIIAEIELKNRCYFYLNYSLEIIPDFKNPIQNFSFINTIHPIGNLSLNHGIILDKISKINHLKIRNNCRNKPKDLQKLDRLLKILSQQFVDLGIDTKVIGKARQSQDALAKINYLRKNFSSKNLYKNWDKVDADGDPGNSINRVLGNKIRGKNLLEIYKQNQKNHQSNNIIFEPRISCEIKKEVNGVIDSLNKILGKNSKINSVIDLLENFEEEYQKIRPFLLKEKYENKNNEINSLLDFILRVTLPNFTKAEGLVLSDFPDENSKKILVQLLFIKKTVDRFLKEELIKIGEKFQSKPQIFLPLCEKEKAINNLEQTIQEILEEILIIAKDSQEKNEQLTKLKNLFVKNNQLVFGAFFGPSDLTANMGGMAIAVINNELTKLLKIYSNFQEKIRPYLNFDEVIFVVEYGKGSSPVRGANYVIPFPQTIQGQALVSSDRFLQKIYDLNKNYQTKSIFIPDKILEAAIKNHRYFLLNKDSLGIVAQEYNELIIQEKPQKLLFVTTKNFANNQGTRGKSGLVKFENQRAIGLATFRVFFGLLQAPFLPYDLSQNKMAFFDKNDFKTFINHPAGFTILLVELYQFLCLDFKRASLIGFSSKAIDETKKYLAAACEFLSEKFEIKNAENLEDFIINLTKELIKSDLIFSNFLRKRAELFLNQIPLIIQLRNEITLKVQDLKNKIDLEGNKLNRIEVDGTALKLNQIRKNDYGEIGTYLNLLTNFQLPIISNYE